VRLCARRDVNSLRPPPFRRSDDASSRRCRHARVLANLTRIVVHGETLPFEYLRLTIALEHGDAVLSWQRVPVTSS
jgi:hypothetical protein